VRAAGRLKRFVRAVTPEDPWAYGVYLLLILAVIVFFFLPGWLVARSDFDNPSEWYKARNDVRTSGIQLLGGFVLVVGSYFTARTLRLNRAGHITDRFSTAVEHLGGGEAPTRLGGIYALQRVMKDSSDDHGPVLEILTAFVRVEGNKPRSDGRKPPVEVAAALRVIGSRKVENDPDDDVLFRLNLSETNLSHCSMRDGDFSRANLWKTNLEHAYLVRSSFRGALLGGTRLDGAKFEGADFTGAKYDEHTQWPSHIDPSELGAVRSD
jgi:hypothetical protein